MLVLLPTTLAVLALACGAVFVALRRRRTAVTAQVAAARHDLRTAAARQRATYRSIRSGLAPQRAQTKPLSTPEPSRSARAPQRRARVPARRLSGHTDPSP